MRGLTNASSNYLARGKIKYKCQSIINKLPQPNQTNKQKRPKKPKPKPTNQTKDLSTGFSHSSSILLQGNIQTKQLLTDDALEKYLQEKKRHRSICKLMLLVYALDTHLSISHLCGDIYPNGMFSIHRDRDLMTIYRTHRIIYVCFVLAT